MESEEETWRLVPFDVGPSAHHFALSDALVRHVHTPTVWWHATDVPTLILGTSQSPGDIDLASCETMGVRIVKRQAGGTAVYAGPGVLGLDVALPAGHRLGNGDLVEAYRWLGEVWNDALRSLGAQTRLVSLEWARSLRGREGPHAAIVRLACFGSLSPYEIVVGQRKLVGLAQVRRRSGTLLQAGIHLHFDGNALAALLPAAERPEVARLLNDSAIGLDEAGREGLSEADVMEAFHRSLGRMVGIRLLVGEWTNTELLHARGVQTELTSLRPEEPAS